MGIRYIKEPELIDPVMIAAWPGIGNIGLIALDTLRRSLQAEQMAYIEPYDFFYPRKAIIRGGELVKLDFPASDFFYHRTGRRDLILFIGEEQPAEGGGVYAAGSMAYDMANLVLDVAEKYGCRRIYTSGAAVAPMHHIARSRAWAVPNSPELIAEFKGYDNTVLMSDIEGRGGEGNIAGLNGLLLGIARRRGIDAVCIMGEIPIYLQGFPFPYPKGSKSVLEVLSKALDIWIDMEVIDELARQSESELTRLYEKLPDEIKQQLDRLKESTVAAAESEGLITEDDKKKILDDIDKFFKHDVGGEQK
ncbi:MAG: PAC2 family protein [Dehalococcoidia bacterium]|nr:PAC2 family protein [Dehalococcoidia bacterium]MDD5648193.1 PAC2 family protein [Dehalococcoidia bacterium]